jgi:hypothetical protein
MRLPVSKASGEPLGPLRQVTLDPAFGLAVSPDGRQVAYVDFAVLFIVAVRKGQFDDLDDPPERMLRD